MKKAEAPKMETKNLILRRRMEDDLPNMVKMFNTEDVRKYLGGYPPRDEHSWLKIVRHRNDHEWAVILKENNEYIGECLLPKIVDNYLGKIGYVFMKEYWGKEYAYEAVSKIVEYCSNVLKLKRLYTTIDNKNNRSKKFIEKIGFINIALLPEADFGGRVTDVAYYAKNLKE